MSNTSMNTEYGQHRRSDGVLENLREFLNATPGIGDDVSNGRVTSTGSTTTRTLADRFADTLHVRDFGVVGDGVTNDTGAFQLAVAEAVSTNKVLDIGNTIIAIDPDTITLSGSDNLTMVGVGRFNCGFVPTGAGDFLFNLDTNALLSVSNIGFNASSVDCGLITGNATTNGQNIVVQAFNCRFSVQGSTTKSAVNLIGFKQSTIFKDNLFQGNNTPSLTGQLFQLQRLLSIPDSGVQAGDENPIIITGNRFTGGAVQFSNFGTDGPPSPLFLHNNTFIRGYCRAIHAYHGEDSFITNNFILGCQGQRPSVDLNNIGGAVWLDIFGATTAGQQNGAVYNDNIVRDCLGVGVLTEETYGVLSGWTVTNTQYFPNAYEYVGSEGFSTRGGYGFVVTSGSRRIGFQVRAEGNLGAAMVIDRTLGVDPLTNIGVVDLQNCHFDENPRNALIIRNRVRKVRIMGGTMAGNGFTNPDTFDAILVDQDVGGQSLTELKVIDCDFDDAITSVATRHCIGKTYAGLYLDIRGCTLNSLSEWVNSGGTVSGNIHNNRCLNNRDFILSGSDVWYFNNTGYDTEAVVNLTTTAGTVTWNNTLSAVPNKVNVTVNNAAGIPLIAATNVLSGSVVVNLYDTNGVLDAGSRDITLRVSVAKSIV